MATLANTGGGVLVCGIDDECAIPLTRSQLDELKPLLFQACVASIEPELSVDIHRLHTLDAAAVLVVEIPKDLSAHKSPGIPSSAFSLV